MPNREYEVRIRVDARDLEDAAEQAYRRLKDGEEPVEVIAVTAPKAKADDVQITRRFLEDVLWFLQNGQISQSTTMRSGKERHPFSMWYSLVIGAKTYLSKKA